MQLTLKNFRYHRDETFDLPDRGLMLISGERGSGKSTILNAIFFVLYGKFRRPYSHGTATCSVTLEEPKLHLKIIRTCHPNHLEVSYDGTIFEDDAAQGVIEKIKGMNMNEFQFSSYFDQKKHASVLSMTPSEQLHFIELIAFVDGDHETVKERVKERIKELETQQTEVNAQLKLLEEQIISRESTLENEDVVPDNINATRTKHATLTNQLRDVKRRLDNKRALASKLQEEEAAQRELEEAHRKLEMEIEHFSAQRSDLGECPTEDQIEIKRIDAETERDIANALLEFRHAKELLAEFEELKKEHFDDLQKQLEALEEKILSKKDKQVFEAKVDSYENERKKCEEMEREMADKKKAVAVITATKKNISSVFHPPKSVKTNATFATFVKNKIAQFTATIAELQAKLDDIECGNLQCPKCRALLRWDEEYGLVETDDRIDLSDADIPDIEMRIASAEANLQILRNADKIFDENIAMATNLPKSKKDTNKDNKVMSLKEFQALSVQLSEQSDLCEKANQLRNAITNKILSKPLVQLQAKIKEKRAGIPKNLDTTRDPDEAIRCAKKLDGNVEEAWRVRGEYTRLTREIETRRKKVGKNKKKFLKKTSDITSAKVAEEVHSLETEMSLCVEQLEELQSLMALIEKYDAHQRAKAEISKLRETKIKKEKELNSIEEYLGGAYGLEKAARDAEFLALEKTIGSINEHARIYLEQMFEDDMSARLIVKKHTKKGNVAARPTIQVQVKYNGAKYDDIEDLSGGERQQCDLAFLLAVNDMLGSNMILLDECLNNLNPDINQDTLNFFREFCGDKQIIVVAHEAVTGIFEHHLHLERK